MVEIIDGVLQLLKDVLVALEFARHVGQRPNRHSRLPLALAERAYADAQPTAFLASMRAKAHLLLGAAAFARCLEQAIDRFRYSRISYEYAFNRPYVGRIGGPNQGTIGRIGVNDSPLLIGDQDA